MNRADAALVNVPANVPLHPWFRYEIAFHTVAFVLLRRLHDQLGDPADLLILYLGAYTIFRLFVEFVRGNELAWAGLRHVPDLADSYLPAPAAYELGLPATQTQPTCILLEDITEPCNLRCPTCFAESSPDLQGVAPIPAILANVEARLSREDARLNVLMLGRRADRLSPAW